MSEMIRRIAMLMQHSIASLTYATWNPSDKGLNITLSNGNLTVDTSSSFTQMARSTNGKTSGKWYYEFTFSSGLSFALVGIENGTTNVNTGLASAVQGISYNAGGTVYKNGVSIATYASYAAGDVIGIAFDASTGSVTFYKNNTLQGTPGSITGTVYAAVGNTTAAAVNGTANFGATTLTYAPPSGYNPGIY